MTQLQTERVAPFQARRYLGQRPLGGARVEGLSGSGLSDGALRDEAPTYIEADICGSCRERAKRRMKPARGARGRHSARCWRRRMARRWWILAKRAQGAAGIMSRLQSAFQ